MERRRGLTVPRRGELFCEAGLSESRELAFPGKVKSSRDVFRLQRRPAGGTCPALGTGMDEYAGWGAAKIPKLDVVGVMELELEGELLRLPQDALNETRRMCFAKDWS